MAVLVNSKQFRNPISGSFTGSFVGNLTGTSSIALTSSYADNFTVGNTLTAQRIVVQTISSSVEFASGSNRFGNDITNTQSFTGSVGITGSLTVAGNILPSADNIRFLGNTNLDFNTVWTRLVRSSAGLSLRADQLFFLSGTSATEILRINASAGNIIIQNGGTFTDNGYRLQVNGSGSLSGSLYVSGSSVFSGSVNVSGSLITTGTITAQTLVVQTVTSSVEFVTGSTRNGSLLANTHQFTGSVSITGSLQVNGSNPILTNQTSSMSVATASYSANSDLLDGKDSTTFATTGSNIFRGNQTITGSFAVSGSTIQVGNNTLVGNTTLTGSITVSGPLRLDPTSDPGQISNTSSFLYTSASNTATGYDLYYRQGENKVKFKWFEGVLNTGILYGGILTYSSSNFYVSSGSGIIVNHNATTGSEISPTITYVNWAASTHSISNPTSQNTYVFIDASGNLQQQTSFFTPEQYHEALPIGRISHYGTIGSLVTGVGNNMLTSYDVPQQLAEFTRAFGPLKTSGFTITPQVGNLSLNIGSGTAFNLGGYYQNSPDLPSSYNSNTYLTSSIIRIHRSGSGFLFDNNGGAYYTTVNPLVYDDGDGTLATVGSGNWSIQRVFVNPITGRSHVYYGQSTYTTYLNAVQSVSVDDFVESEVTKNAYVFAGYLVMKGGAANDDLSVGGTTNAIIQSGLFRNSVGGSGGASIAVSDLNDLSDVNITSPSNGQALIYSSGNWINGTPISASNAATASSADNFTVRGILTAQTIVAQTITSSIEFVTGSTRNGSLLSNTHQFTGSVGITGSLNSNLFTDGFITMSAAQINRTGGAVELQFGGSSNVRIFGAGSNPVIFNPNGSSTFSGSVNISSSLSVNGTATIKSASLDYQQNLAVATGSFQTITSVATGSFRAAFFDYVTFSGSIVRAGTIVSTWSGSVTEFYENFTEDLGGSTSVVTLRTAISGSNIQLQAGISGSAWSVRSLVRLL